MINKQISIIKYNIFCSVLFLLLINSIDISKNFSLMMIYSLNSAVVFFYLLYNEIKYFSGLKLNLLLLFSYIIRLVLPSITLSLAGINEDKIYWFENYDITNSIFESTILMNFYYSIFFYCIIRYAGNANIETYIRPYLVKLNITVIAGLLFLVGVLFNFVIEFLPYGTVPFFIYTILGYFTTLALLLQMLNAALIHSKKKYLFFTFLVVLEVIRTAFGGFYKGPIMYALFFFILYHVLYTFYNRGTVLSSKVIVFAISFFLILSNIIYPFMNLKREYSNWDIASGGIVNSQYSNLDILGQVLNGKNIEREKKGSTFDRLDALSNNSFFVNYVKINGNNIDLLTESIQALIPRFINSDKHNSRSGLMATAIIQTGSIGNYTDALSNSYVGQMASSYMIGGYLFVLLFSFLNGFIIAKYYKYLLNNISNIIALAFLVQLLISGVNGFEETHDGGVTRCLLFIMYMVLIKITSKIFKIKNV